MLSWRCSRLLLESVQTVQNDNAMQVGLNVYLAGLIKKVKFIGPQIRIVARCIWVGTGVAASRRLDR
jgi:hypothetical protein